MVVEAPGGGYDRVASYIDWTLSAGTERLSLIGTLNLSGTGNGLDNRLDGNAGANRLDRAEGNDSLYGVAGADTLAGGAGNDVLVGGSEADFFVFAALPQAGQGDTVTDSSPGSTCW